MLESVCGENWCGRQTWTQHRPCPAETLSTSHKISQCHKELLYKRDCEVGKKEATVGEGEVGSMLT